MHAFRLSIAALFASALFAVAPTPNVRAQTQVVAPASPGLPSSPVVASLPVVPSTARSPRNANYTIEATLDAPSRTIRASEAIIWRNISSSPTSELQFHLYWNAWTDRKSTWMLEKMRTERIDRPADDFSRFTIERVALNGTTDAEPATDLTATVRYIAPDDGNAGDRTVMSVALPRAVQPGETIRVSVSWNARVPRTFDRTGTIGNYFFIAQWFPKLGVLESQGWNCHQFHASTEFFADYGVYDVSLTVPSGWMVGATGTERERRDNGNGTTRHRFVQEDVHDFAWTTSPDFIERTSRFESSGLPAVDLRLLIQPEHIAQAERHFEATRVALQSYGTWYGAYPYGHLTIVDPAFQSETGGMEYPTLFTAGTQWLISSAVTPQTPEEVTIHEAGHQFWYGISGSNEFEHAWMDEGINSFSTARALTTRFPETFLSRTYFWDLIPWTFRDIRLHRETDWNGIWGYRPNANQDTLSGLSFKQRPETVFPFAYDKPAIWLNTLERWLGWDVVQRGLKRAFTAAAFSHPTPDVVLHSIEVESGRDLSSFYAQTYTGSAVFDYAVTELESDEKDKQFHTRVLVRRLDDGVFPVDIRVTFENGEQVTEHWTGESRWRELTYLRPSRIKNAIVDPDRVLLLDVNFTNNSRALHSKADAAAWKWSLKWMVWLQDALLTWGLFA